MESKSNSTIKILEYADLDIFNLKRQYEKVIAHLERGDFYSAEVKKFPEYGIYRAKLDDTNRLLFKLGSYKGEPYILILEVVLNHAYDRSKFLRGAKIDELKIPEIPESQVKDEDLLPLAYVNPSKRGFHFLDKIISFDPEQEEAYWTLPPLIIIGPAGSGKTVLTLEKMKRFSGRGIYVTLSPFLADNARNMYYSHHYENDDQEVSFYHFREFLETFHVPEGKEIRYGVFSKWISKFPRQQRVADANRLYEEFRGVITGSIIDKPWLGREEYLNLGVRQSIFLRAEREIVYTLFEKYLQFLKENNYYDPNIIAHNYLRKVGQIYDFVVVDEVPDITNIQLYFILRSLKEPNNFILCGDSNQMVHPNFFSWSKLKSMLYNSAPADVRKVTRILQSNFRNSIAITELSNKLLKIKQRRFGSIDRESTYLMKSLTGDKGEVIFLKDTEKVKRELNQRIRFSTKFALLVMRDEEKEAACQFFDTPLLFSIPEAKGLEYENVILLNFVSGERESFEEIVKGISHEDTEDDIQYIRAADKTDKSLEAYKFFINSLYVGITRAVNKLYIIEKDTGHPLYSLLGLRNALEQAMVEVAQSSKDEWQAEARRLELQGRYEQAEEIRRSILKNQPVPWEVCTPERVIELVKQVQTAKDNPQKPRKTLFEYALFYDAPKVIEFLSVHNFDKAKQIYFLREYFPYFNKSLYKQQRNNLAVKYLQSYKGAFYQDIIRQCELYGIDHRTVFNKTPLMLAASEGNISLIQDLLSAGADTELTDNCGLTAWQNALGRALLDKQFASSLFGTVHEILAPSSLSIEVDNRLIKIDSVQGEFLVFQVFFVLLHHHINYIIHGFQFSAVELAELVSSLPYNAVPEYRKNRAYLSALLSKNELNSTNPYCKKLFLRTTRGYYILNPDLQTRQKDEWINVYKLANIQSTNPFASEWYEYISSLRR